MPSSDANRLNGITLRGMARPLHEHLVYRISSIGRPVDPRSPSNATILIVVAIAAISGSVWGWMDVGSWQAALSRGGTAASLAFLSWAIGRELDPDLDATAFVAVAGALAAWILIGGPGIWFMVAALGGARLVNRTVGPPARLTDAGVILVVLAIGVLVAGHWSIAIVGAVAFVLDASLRGGLQRSWVFAVSCVGLWAAAWALGDVIVGWVAAPWWLGVLALVCVMAIATWPTVRSSGDLPGYPLHLARVRGGMVVALLTGMLAQFEASDRVAAPALLATLAAMVLGRLWPRR